MMTPARPGGSPPIQYCGVLGLSASTKIMSNGPPFLLDSAARRARGRRVDDVGQAGIDQIRTRSRQPSDRVRCIRRRPRGAARWCYRRRACRSRGCAGLRRSREQTQELAHGRRDVDCGARPPRARERALERRSPGASRASAYRSTATRQAASPPAVLPRRLPDDELPSSSECNMRGFL